MTPWPNIEDKFLKHFDEKVKKGTVSPIDRSEEEMIGLVFDWLSDNYFYPDEY